MLDFLAYIFVSLVGAAALGVIVGVTAFFVSEAYSRWRRGRDYP